MGQALNAGPHPTCSASLGPQDLGQVWYCHLHVTGEASLVPGELGFVPLAVLGHICLFHTVN